MNRNKVIMVKNLELWLENPRIKPAKNEHEAIRSIYNETAKKEKKSREEFMSLMHSIAKNGYQNEVEPILVMHTSDDRYIVRDANRRISALKILLDPEPYKDILTAQHLERAKAFNREFSDNIPEAVTVAVFEESEQDILEGILQRKHNGPQDGVGTVPWSLEAKDRFSKNKNQFSDRLEHPFDLQYGQTLTSYIGGDSSKSTTRRLISSRVSQRYLRIADPDNPTPEELDRVKFLADKLKDAAADMNIPLSRMNNDRIQETIDKISKADSNNVGTSPNPPHEDSDKPFRPEDYDIPNEDHMHTADNVLGGQWNIGDYMQKLPLFNNLNLVLSALAVFGAINIEQKKRYKKIALLAPSARLIFELSLRTLKESGVVDHLLGKNWHTNDDYKNHVGKIYEEAFNTSEFKRYLSDNNIIADSYKNCTNTISNIDMAAMAGKSVQMAHTGRGTFTQDEIKETFNNAVLFAYLCENYIAFRNREDGPLDESPITMQS